MQDRFRSSKLIASYRQVTGKLKEGMHSPLSLCGRFFRSPVPPSPHVFFCSFIVRPCLSKSYAAAITAHSADSVIHSIYLPTVVCEPECISPVIIIPAERTRFYLCHISCASLFAYSPSRLILYLQIPVFVDPVNDFLIA